MSSEKLFGAVLLICLAQSLFIIHLSSSVTRLESSLNQQQDSFQNLVSTLETQSKIQSQLLSQAQLGSHWHKMKNVVQQEVETQLASHPKLLNSEQQDLDESDISPSNSQPIKLVR
ncbi:MAG: hypothetical protein OQJ89_05780 [Kangiellaceae bacterium]|nr:hypothetical protein [Kangiellaceae bacterium]MCW9000984.1 hypothetical protein [Kangiellaceae bacterium]MCW9016451.1 hypothetical protein [Kangiellaceae bacterium]